MNAAPSEGADLRVTLERYAMLPAQFIRDQGGDRFAKPVAISHLKEILP